MTVDAMYSWLSRAIFLNVVVTVASWKECKIHWKRVDSSCFRNFPSLNITWKEANDSCSAQASQLASVHSEHQGNFLVDILNNTESWIGIKAEANSTLEQLDGCTAQNFDGLDFNQDHLKPKCVAIERKLTLRETSCKEKRRYMCQRPLGSTDCPKDWQKHRQLCYWTSNISSDHDTARSKCQKMNATLLSITKTADYYSGANLSVWLSFVKRVNSTKYESVQGVAVNLAQLDDSFRAKKNIQTKSCLTITSDVKFNIKECNTRLHSYVCRMELEKDLSISVAEINETSARILWSVNSPSCDRRDEVSWNVKLSVKGKEERSQTTKSMSIIFNNLKPNTTYRVNIAGMKNTKDFSTLEIRNVLNILNISSDRIYAKVGDTVNLRCAVTGEPQIRFSWTKTGRTIKSFIETSSPHRSSLVSVTLKDDNDFGEYICNITDRFSNKISKIVLVNVKEGNACDDDDIIWIITAVTLASIVAILIILLVFTIKYMKRHKPKLGMAQQADDVTLTNLSRDEEFYDKPQNMNTAKNKYESAREEDNSPYATLNAEDMQQQEDENFYSPLQDAPLYVNTTELRNSGL